MWRAIENKTKKTKRRPHVQSSHHMECIVSVYSCIFRATLPNVQLGKATTTRRPQSLLYCVTTAEGFVVFCERKWLQQLCAPQLSFPQTRRAKATKCNDDASCDKTGAHRRWRFVKDNRLHVEHSLGVSRVSSVIGRWLSNWRPTCMSIIGRWLSNWRPTCMSVIGRWLSNWRPTCTSVVA